MKTHATPAFGAQITDSTSDQNLAADANEPSPSETGAPSEPRSSAARGPSETLTEADEADSVPESDGRKRRKKRTRFKVPEWKPRPVKALWESASDEERERAHQTAMVILEYWTAQLSKPEAAERLGLAPIRVWQLSQQAVSGMLAGLLTQPRDRSSKLDEGKEIGGRVSHRERGLEKQVKTLEQKLRASQRLVEVMRELPVMRASREAAPQVAASKTKRKVRIQPKRNGKATTPRNKARPG